MRTLQTPPWTVSGGTSDRALRACISRQEKTRIQEASAGECEPVKVGVLFHVGQAFQTQRQQRLILDVFRDSSSAQLAGGF